MKTIVPVSGGKDSQVVLSLALAEGAPLNPLYSRGHHRVGCYPCFLARKSEWEACGKDETGRDHIRRLLELESTWNTNGNPRKFIRVHRTWDVRAFLDAPSATADLFESEQECGWCSI